MDTLGNVILGLVFLGLAMAGTFLMYKLWEYPFDKTTLRSSAPRPLVLLHRSIGYAYLAVYLYLMSQMVPRLWSYQVEFPARTVAHFMLGMAIGAILIVKVMVVRFFKHLESKMVPFLGTSLLICTFLLIGLSVPFALREFYLNRSVAREAAFSPYNIERVKKLLPLAGFPDDAPLGELASVGGLRGGRKVLLGKCVQCHDLRTVLLRPRTPEVWADTVERMAERSLLANPIDEREQWNVAAYLIAITPELQESFKKRRKQELVMDQSKRSVESIAASAEKATASREAVKGPFDLSSARGVFETTCVLCHALTNVDNAPPSSAMEARALVARMVGNGLTAPEEMLEQIIYYLTDTYAN